MEAKGSADFALKVGVSRRYGSSILSKPLLFVVACNFLQGWSGLLTEILYITSIVRGTRA
jgi:hypothetical protein